jgi:class 3 adenylate cyclase/YHS domain-containing protein
VAEAASSRAEHTFVFADLSGFTALTEAHGDEQAADLVATFVSAVSPLLATHNARLVKTIGDALMIDCSDAALAIRLGIRIVGEVGGQHGFPIVRVGMHTGPAAERDGDWFGATVNLASRISAVARGGEVVVSDTTRQAARDVPGIELHERGPHSLRNTVAPVLLFEAVEKLLRPHAGLPIDPVCRMSVDPQHAVRTWHDGVEYHFCSRECQQTFAARPELYIPMSHAGS